MSKEDGLTNEEVFDGAVTIDTNKPEDDLEIEIIDDTPEEDKGKKPLKEIVEPPAEDELDSYDEKVQKRFKKLTHSFHDERRAKEAATRERDEALRFAQQVYEQNKYFEQQLAAGSKVYIDKSVSEAQTSLEAAEQEYRNAYEAGDTDKVVAAQKKMMAATVALAQAKELKPLTTSEEQGYIPQQPIQSAQQAAAPVPDAKAKAWVDKNPWFFTERRMNALARAISEELVLDGVDPTSDEYYQQIDAGMREAFPRYFNTESSPDRENKQSQRAKPNTVVAPATRGSAPKKITLTSTQVAFANRLGIPLKEYAKEVQRLAIQPN